MKKIDIPVVVLAVWNIIGGILHMAFEFFLFADQSAFRGFLLIENFLIGCVFLYLGIQLFFNLHKDKKAIVKVNLLFWFLFCVSILLFKPEITSLNMFRQFLFFVPQMYILFFIGVVAFVLSLIIYRREVSLKKKK